jgi:hypothetical protein
MRLFRPAWDSKNGRRAKKAVEKITDEAKLERIAKEARSGGAREAAVERVTNQSLLADIAQNDKEYYYVRIAAVKRVTDQSILADVAQNDKDSDVRWAAVERVTDQSVLTDIAKNDKDSDVRRAAVERVTDQSLLTDIAQNDKENIYVRIAASHGLVNYDLEDDLLMYIIHMLGGELENSENNEFNFFKKVRSSAAETLLAYSRRYEKGEHGKEIRKYEGKHGYSDHSDSTESDKVYESCCPVYHSDTHNDTTYTINFNPEEA